MRRLGLNLLTAQPSARDGEATLTIATGTGVRIERIVSLGQASPPGFWYELCTESMFISIPPLVCYERHG